MAGGMNRRGDRRSLQERVHGRRAPTSSKPANVRHCWVTDRHGHLPGLLSEWRRTTAGGWEGYVTHPVLESYGWVLVTEWMPAELLEPAP